MQKFCLLCFLLFLPALACAELSSVAKSALSQNAPEECPFEDESHNLGFIVAGGKLAGMVNGGITATMGWDFNNIVDSPNEFTVSDIPTDAAGGNGGKFNLSAQQSFMQLNIVAMPGDDNRVGAYIRVTLLGQDYAPWIEYALLNWRGVSAGYGYTLFSDGRSALPGIDFKGSCAFTGVSNTVLQYRHRLNDQLTVGAALEMPLLSATYGSGTAKVTQRMPDIPVMGCYNWEAGHLRFSAILRNMQYRDVPDERNGNCVGYGVQFSGSATLLPGLCAYWQGAYGKGISSYFQDLTDKNLDMTPDNEGKMRAVRAWGTYGGLQYEFYPGVSASAGYSMLRAYPHPYATGIPAYANQVSYTQYAVGNLFWEVNSFITLGVEYIYGRRVDIDHQQGHASRLQSMLKFSF